MEDSGVFSAVAENRGGKAKCSANLVVEERRQIGRKGNVPPSFLNTVQNTVVKAGQLARFDARVTGTKPLDVYWLKNGKKIASDIRYKVVEEDNLYTLLIIETVPEDSGTYECVAINNAGEARCEAECTIQPTSTATAKTKTQTQTQTAQQQAPSIVEPLKGLVMKEGQPAVFKCKISGKAPLQIKWYKGDEIIKPSKYFQMSREGDTNTLRISEVFPEDEGEYKCIVSNQGGKVQVSAPLKVLAPETTDVAPTLSPMKNVTVLEGNPAQFRTQVTGKPKPTIQWFREGALIPQSPDFEMTFDGTSASLVITSTYEEDSGTFTCRATSTAGQVETSALLTVKPSN